MKRHSKRIQRNDKRSRIERQARRERKARRKKIEQNQLNQQEQQGQDKQEQGAEKTEKKIIALTGVFARGFGKVSRTLLEDPRLTNAAKALYCFLALYGQIAYPKVETQMKSLKLSKKRYDDARKLLEELGYIKVEKISSSGWKHNLYTLSACHNGEDIFAHGFGLVPRTIMEDQDLSVEAKVIYAYLSCFAGASGNCNPAVKTQIITLKMNKDTYRKHRKQLIDRGYVTISQEREGVCEKFARNRYSLEHYPKIRTAEQAGASTSQSKDTPVPSASDAPSSASVSDANKTDVPVPGPENNENIGGDSWGTVNRDTKKTSVENTNNILKTSSCEDEEERKSQIKKAKFKEIKAHCDKCNLKVETWQIFVLINSYDNVSLIRRAIATTAATSTVKEIRSAFAYIVTVLNNPNYSNSSASHTNDNKNNNANTTTTNTSNTADTAGDKSASTASVTASVTATTSNTPRTNNRFNAFPQREYTKGDFRTLEQRLLDKRIC